ncbi:MAG TPA: hypothetical protein PLF40_20120, partial [Kofleriaceae bacterium]|nr:hypothetical protein [Kofleriaceae bacterium]
FYRLLSSEGMTGAKFGVPEIMAFYPADATHARDRANINIKYLDNAGNPGNRTGSRCDLCTSDLCVPRRRSWLL